LFIQVPDVEVELDCGKSTIFQAVQSLIQQSQLGTKQEKLRRIWEPTYTIVYKEEKEFGKESEEKESLDAYGLGLNVMGIGSRTISPSPSSLCQSACTVEEVVSLLRHLYSLSPVSSKQNGDVLITTPDYPKSYYIPMDEFVSKKITNKLAQQLQDPLVLASRALPSWCEDLTYSAPMLFPFETRNLYFSCTAYGTSR